MGNLGLCGSRGFPTFIAPNTENVTFKFDYKRYNEIEFGNGTKAPTTANGLLLEAQFANPKTLKWHNIKEYSPSAAHLSVCVSGRVYVRCFEKIVANTAPQGLCAFKVCTRGCPVFGTIQTSTCTHTAPVMTCGVCFCLNITVATGKIYLCPRIILALDSGDEVLLVGDHLGPLQPPLSFYTDFAIVDDGGRNIQMDLIFRGEQSAAAGHERGMQTLRTCLQESQCLTINCILQSYRSDIRILLQL